MNKSLSVITGREARYYRTLILGLCIGSLICVFQPFSLSLYSVGCVGVIIGGLVFNLMPFCFEGNTRRKLVVAFVWIFGVLAVMGLLATAAANAYFLYLSSSR